MDFRPNSNIGTIFFARRPANKSINKHNFIWKGKTEKNKK